jgi:23S rRNA pseudouridine1911/1915/1917 synthase
LPKDREERLTVGPDEDRLRLDRFLADRLPRLSRARIQKLAREGRIQVNGSAARPSRPVRTGESVEIVIPAPAPSTLIPEPIPLEVLYEDPWILVISKAAGMVVHPGAGRRSGTLVHALLARGPGWSTIGGEERPGIVHRLDRGTSGVMVIARNDDAHRSLSAQFKARTVEKTYMALVWGVPHQSRFTVDAALGRDKLLRRRVSSRTRSPREAATHFTVRETLGPFTLLEVKPLTGRTHQIRAHLLSAGHPIVGDQEYGGARWRGLPEGEVREKIRVFGRLGLHALRLAFDHPSTGERERFEAPLPPELTELLMTLRDGPSGQGGRLGGRPS